MQGGDNRGVVLPTSSRWRCGTRASRDRPLEQQGGCWGGKRAFCEVTLGTVQTILRGVVLSRFHIWNQSYIEGKKSIPLPGHKT